MKLTYILALWLISVSAVAYAPIEQPRDKQSVGTIYSIGKCSFRINNLFGGAFSAHEEAGGYTGLKSNNNPVFSTYCKAGISQDEVYDQLDAKQVNGQWIWPDAGEKFTPGQRFNFMKFTGKNWSGFASGYDMITGPEDQRQRLFRYCLVETNGHQVACGQAFGLDTSSPETTKVIQSILAVLKTFEFVDPPAPDVSGNH